MTPKIDEPNLADMLDVLTETGNGVVTLSDGQVVHIHKCKVKASGMVIAFIEKAFDDVVAIVKAIADERKAVSKYLDGSGLDPNTLEAAEAATNAITKPSTRSILQMISKHWVSLSQLVSALTSLTPEQYEELPMDDGIKILIAIWVVNKNFFSNQIRPMLATLKASNE